MYPINRRKFLFLSACTAGAVLLTQCNRNLSSVSFTQPANATLLLTSTKGLLDTTLEARSSSIKLGQQQGSLMTYNGQIPGPRLEAKPGDTVRIRFMNQLKQATNLHYHGLHIPPTGQADNIFISVPPGETHT